MNAGTTGPVCSYSIRERLFMTSYQIKLCLFETFPAEQPNVISNYNKIIIGKMHKTTHSHRNTGYKTNKSYTFSLQTYLFAHKLTFRNVNIKDDKSLKTHI